MLFFWTALILLFSAVMSPASAQSLRDDDVISVRERLAPEYLALGVRAGGMIITPGLSVEETYDDNVFRTTDNEEEDFITVLEPTVNVQTDWNLHQVELDARGEVGYYADNSDENYQDYAAGLSGRYDIAHQTYLTGALRHEKRHENRDSPDDVRGDEPTEYDRTTARVEFVRALARLKLRTSGRYRVYRFDDARRQNVIVDNSGRDREEQRYEGRLSYELSPGYDLYVSGAWDVREYDRSGAQDRSSKGYEANVGTAVNISGKLRGDIYGGYTDRDYDRGFEDIETGNVGGAVLWNVSGLTSLRGSLERDVFETTGTGVSGYIRTGGGLSVEHALRRYIILDGFVHFDEDEFIGSGTNREDETYRAGLGVEYKPRRGTTIQLGYDYRDRDSTNAPANYTNHRFRTSLHYNY